MTTTPEALLDSNVVIAAIAFRHERHEISAALLNGREPSRYAFAAHSFAEAYSTLTRRNAASPFHFAPEQAWTALQQVASMTTLVGLTPARMLDTIRRYALAGGVGPRLYDALIGESAEAHGIPRIITWNVGHMRSLFPNLSVVDPSEILTS